MELVGEYVSLLRSASRLTQVELADKIGVHVRTVRNLESGRHEPKPTDLAAVLELLHGSWVHVAQLLQPSATKTLVERLAREAISGQGFTDEQRALLEGLTPDQKAAILTVARQMQQ